MIPSTPKCHSRVTRTRREFVREACCGFSGLALASLLHDEQLRAASSNPLAAKRPHVEAKAKSARRRLAAGSLAARLDIWNTLGQRNAGAEANSRFDAFAPGKAGIKGFYEQVELGAVGLQSVLVVVREAGVADDVERRAVQVLRKRLAQLKRGNTGRVDLCGREASGGEDF